MKRWILAYALYLPLYGIPAAAAHSEGSNTAGAVRLDSAIQDLGASTLQDGTPLTVVLKETVRGGRVAAGSPVSLSVASDVLAPNGRDVILRAGTPAYGVVSESGGAGAFGRSGKLKITCDYVAGADGVRIPLRPASKNGAIRSSGRSSTSAATITGVLVFIPTWIALDFSMNGIDG